MATDFFRGLSWVWLKPIFLTFFLGFGFATYGTDYFVSKAGRDDNDGLSGGKAFLSIRKGVDSLNEGDVLTIGPGEYFERVIRNDLGGDDKDTLIRAEIPGTVVLRGDVSAPKFEPVDGFRFVYSASFDEDVQAVNEVDTLTILESAPNARELEFTPGSFFYDAGAKRLFISTSDLRPPDVHHYTVSVIKNNGLFLLRPRRVVIEGISVTGFNCDELLAGSPGYYTVWGIMLLEASKCVIRDCKAFLNAGGIAINSMKYGIHELDANGIPYCRKGEGGEAASALGGNLIEGCEAYGNYSPYSSEGGNITIFHSNGGEEIRNCVARDGATHGIRLYGKNRGPAILRGNLSWGHSINDLCVKGGPKDGVAHGFGVAENCVALGPMHVTNVKHCISGAENRYNSNPDASNVRYDLEAAVTSRREFADPDNLDFRLQADSSFRGTGPDGVDRGAFPYEPNIFYVKPDGDDQADGLSMARAWKSLPRALKRLRPGNTLYLAGGTYAAAVSMTVDGSGDKPIVIRGRGRDPVVISGSLDVVKCVGVTFERLNFSDVVSVQGGRDVTFNNCRFKMVEADSVAGLTVAHCVFTGFKRVGLSLTGCSDVFLSGNIYDNLHGAGVSVDQTLAIRYSDYNCYRNAKSAWRVDGALTPLTPTCPGHDRYSRVATPMFTSAGGFPVLENGERFSAGGPNGTPFGVWNVFKRPSRRVTSPTSRSVTSTTADVEWWTSFPARCRLSWGGTPDRTKEILFNVDGFGSYSLTGLKPSTTYYLKLEDACPLASSGVRKITPLKPLGVLKRENPASGTATLEFTTLGSDPDPVVYHVAPDGNDENDGLSRWNALRTIARAADLARAGDTVEIAGGVYTEIVRPRSTGTKERPVTFKAAPGEKVVMDGDNFSLNNAFVVSGKRHLRFDGLRFRKFALTFGRMTGIFDLYKSDDASITRCFGNGYGAGYPASFVSAFECAGLTIGNCVAANSFYGNLYLVKCPDAVIENNVLIRSLIMELVLVNEPGQKVTLKKNIITDNTPRKVKVPLLEVSSMTSLEEANNCYYLRIPVDERKLISLYDPVAYERAAVAFGLKPAAFSELVESFDQLTLPQYQKASGNKTSFAKDPLLKGTFGMKRMDENGNPLFLAGRLLGKKDLDFNDFFATNPEVVNRGIGLIPKDFKDFNFINK